jgi:Tfp pilus assembly protein FimV
MNERASLEARRDELRAALAELRRKLELRHEEVAHAVAVLRAERDERLREVTRLETAAADATGQLANVQSELDEALREERAARNHLWDLKG